MIEQIKAAVHRAAGNNQKIAMFHFQVLKNANELAGIDPKGFCKEISVPETYATEFTKMIALARLMKEQGTEPKENNDASTTTQRPESGTLEKNDKLQADPAHSAPVQGSDSGRAEGETARETKQEARKEEK